MTEELEKKIASKVLTAPRVTVDDINANIIDEVYFTAEGGVLGNKYLNEDSATAMVELAKARKYPRQLKLLTFCVLVLRNGFTVTGESACVSPENFDAQIGRDVARKNAIEKIWPLMGYALKEKLANE
jgi:hypothetical protein